jgi:hypothetical protein
MPTLGAIMNYNPESSQRNRVMVLLLTIVLVAVATGFGVFLGLLLAR